MNASDYIPASWHAVKSVHCDHYPGHVATTDGGGSSGGGTTATLRAGQLMQDRSGAVWEVVQLPRIGTAAARLGLRSHSGITSPISGGDWSLSGAMRRAGSTFLTESGRAIELNPDGTFTEYALSESANLFPTSPGGRGGGGGGGGSRVGAAGPTAEDTAFLRQQTQRLREQTEIDRQQIALQREAEENRRRESLFDIGSRLQVAAQQLLDQALARQTELVGRSPVRAASRAAGLTPRGQEPADVLRGQLAALVPQLQGAGNVTLDPRGSIASLEQGVSRLRRLPTSLPQPGGPLGFAEGGVIEMRQGEPGGAFEMDGPGGDYAVLSGGNEFTGAPDSEVTIMRPERGEVEFVPLVGRAQSGGTSSFPLSFGTALSPLYDALGFSGIPTVRQVPGNKGVSRGSVLDLKRQTGIGGVEGLRRIGLNPEYVRDYNTGAIYRLTDGVRQHIPSLDLWRQFGVHPRDVLNLTAGQIAELAPTRGSALTRVPSPVEPGVSQRAQGFPLPRVPLTVDIGGQDFLLPDPRTFAADFRRWSPDIQFAILDAFDAAGLRPEQFAAIQSFFTPRGTARRAGAAAFG